MILQKVIYFVLQIYSFYLNYYFSTPLLELKQFSLAPHCSADLDYIRCFLKGNERLQFVFMLTMMCDS